METRKPFRCSCGRTFHRKGNLLGTLIFTTLRLLVHWSSHPGGTTSQGYCNHLQMGSYTGHRSVLCVCMLLLFWCLLVFPLATKLHCFSQPSCIMGNKRLVSTREAAHPAITSTGAWKCKCPSVLVSLSCITVGCCVQFLSMRPGQSSCRLSRGFAYTRLKCLSGAPVS